MCKRMGSRPGLRRRVSLRDEAPGKANDEGSVGASKPSAPIPVRGMTDGAGKRRFLAPQGHPSS
jgi:hypothetical protein